MCSFCQNEGEWLIGLIDLVYLSCVAQLGFVDKAHTTTLVSVQFVRVVVASVQLFIYAWDHQLWFQIGSDYVNYSEYPVQPVLLIFVLVIREIAGIYLILFLLNLANMHGKLIQIQRQFQV